MPRRGVRVRRDDPPGGHVPELALAAGVVVALTVLAAGVLLGAGLRATVVLGAVALAPFLAYAVRHSPDPTGVVPPRPVAGLSLLAGTTLLVESLLGAGLAGLPVGLALFVAFGLPALAYLARYDTVSALAPRRVAPAAVLVSPAVLGVSLALSRPVLGAATALAVSLAATRHAARGGLAPTRRSRRRVVGGLVSAGVVLAGVGALTGPSTPTVVTGCALALGGGLFGALARPASRKC